jgi:hypothetical protein
MQKLHIIISLALLFICTVPALSQQTDSTKTNEKSWTLFWGLFNSDDEGEARSSRSSLEFETSTPEQKTELDTTKYEIKSYLWGAIQYTRRKENTPLTE